MRLTDARRAPERTSWWAAAAGQLEAVWRSPWALPVATAVALAVVSLPHVARGPLPPGDGGLFYLMVQELARTFPLLPRQVIYSGMEVPYAYPPLGFYLTYLADRLGPWSLLDVMRYLPLLFTALAGGAAAAVVQELAPSRRVALLAAPFLVGLSRLWAGQVVGGGITRAPGLFFCLLALLLAVRQARDGRVRRALPVCQGLAMLCHPEMGVYAAAQPFLMAAALPPRDARGRALKLSLLAACGAAVVSAPWWIAVSLRYGPDILFGTAAGSRGDALQHLGIPLLPPVYGEPFPWVLATLGLAGLLLMAPVSPLPLAWTAFLVLVDPRKATVLAVLPLALAGGLLLERIVGLERRRPGLTAAALAVALLALAVRQGVMAPANQGSPLAAVTGKELAMMRELGATAPGASVLVLTGMQWARDPVSEWLPALAPVKSVLTVQGSEWLGRDEFQRRIRTYHEAQDCVREGDASCVLEALARHGLGADIVWAPERCGCDAVAREVAMAMGARLIQSDQQDMRAAFERTSDNNSGPSMVVSMEVRRL